MEVPEGCVWVAIKSQNANMTVDDKLFFSKND